MVVRGGKVGLDAKTLSKGEWRVEKKKSSHSVFPLEVKPLLVRRQNSKLPESFSHWPATKTTIKGDEYFMGSRGTMGLRVWAIVRVLSVRTREAKLFYYHFSLSYISFFFLTDPPFSISFRVSSKS